jgi:hypothetical protein
VLAICRWASLPTDGAEAEGGKETVEAMKKMIRTALALFAASVVIGPGEYFLRWIR